MNLLPTHTYIADVKEVSFLCVVQLKVRWVHRSELLFCDNAFINNNVVYKSFYVREVLFLEVFVRSMNFPTVRLLCYSQMTSTRTFVLKTGSGSGSLTLNPDKTASLVFTQDLNQTAGGRTVLTGVFSPLARLHRTPSRSRGIRTRPRC